MQKLVCPVCGQSSYFRMDAENGKILKKRNGETQ